MGYIYVAVVIMLVSTAAIVWIECFISCFPQEPPEKPGAPYPPASAIIAAYLSNEAETILDTMEAFMELEYPAPLQVSHDSFLKQCCLHAVIENCTFLFKDSMAQHISTLKLRSPGWSPAQDGGVQIFDSCTYRVQLQKGTQLC